MPTFRKPFSSRPSTQLQGKGQLDTRTIPVVQNEASVSSVVEKIGKALRTRMDSHQERQRVSPAPTKISSRIIGRIFRPATAHTLAGDPRYQGRDATIEPEIRRDWEKRYPGSTWESVKLVVRHGWETVTG